MSEAADLLAVQDLDTRADQLRYRRVNMTERAALAEAARALGSVDDEVGALRARAGALAGAQRRLEAAVADLEAKRTGLERKLSTTSVPREAEALSSELAAHRERLGEHEDELLEVLVDAEGVEERLTALDTARPPLAQAVEQAEAAVAAEEAVIDAELAAVAAARAEAAGALPGSFLDRYERLRSRLGGVAVARLEQGRCTGCSLALSTSELEAARRAPAGSPVECEHCGRLLVP